MRTLLLGAALIALTGCAHVASERPTAAPASVADMAVALQPVHSDFTALLKNGQDVSVDNPYGDIRLRFGGFAQTLEINAVVQNPPGAAPIALQPGEDSGRYVVAPRLPAGAFLASGQRIDIVVFVPAGHAVAAHTERGLIESHGIRGDVDLQSTAGNIAIRATLGSVRAQTGAGSIEASLNPALPSSHQRLATTTGDIVLGVNDKLDAELELATSGLFATEYSLEISRLPGQEPNKHARTVIGANKAHVNVQSRRGEIRLLRRSDFTSLDGKSADEEHEDTDAD